jgi:FMN reductase
LFSFFQALTLPIGVYAAEADFRDYRIASATLQARIDLAAQRAAAVLGSATATSALRKIA